MANGTVLAPVPITDNKTSSVSATLDRLRPYEFHGVHLEPISNREAVGDCPFCGKDAKFSVNLDTGLWRCFVCGSGSPSGGGNALTFIRLVYEHQLRCTPPIFSQYVINDRKLLSTTTVEAWGVCYYGGGSLDSWLVPGYFTDGKLDQLYKRGVDGILYPTPGVWPEGKCHALHMTVGDFDPKRPSIVITEGPWDGMALSEAGRQVWGDANIVAVPGCNVWRDEWTQLCTGKAVVLLYDSDHPTGPNNSKAGWDGMRRVCRRLSGFASTVRIVKWGPDGYDSNKPSGWDVRDLLTTTTDRRIALVELISKIEPSPGDWFSPTTKATNGNGLHGGTTRSCSTWQQCINAWDKKNYDGAIHLRQDLIDVLAVLLAVAASTQQSGNQLFLDIIGAPGSAKTTLAQGLLTSEHCIALENMTKLISGYKKEGENDKDCSFLARNNNKMWITCEFDVLGSSPEYMQLMGKIRRIFDGETVATYGNSDEDRKYGLLRTPWARCGTHKMMDRMADRNESQLGDRFLRIIIGDPTQEEKREITRSAMKSERLAMLNQATGPGGSCVDEKTQLAQEMTGGYVDWLWANVEEQLNKLDVSEEAEDYCIDLAELSADLRARPNEGKHNIDSHDTKELPTRLARQNIRLASCLAVVLNKNTIDSDVLRIVRKVALDTANGHSLSIVEWLSRVNFKDPAARTWQDCGGIGMETLAMWLNMTTDRTQKYLMFMRKIGVLDWHQRLGTAGTWAMTERVCELYSRIMGGVN
jgi:hypothetical protein